MKIVMDLLVVVLAILVTMVAIGVPAVIIKKIADKFNAYVVVVSVIGSIALMLFTIAVLFSLMKLAIFSVFIMGLWGSLIATDGLF